MTEWAYEEGRWEPPVTGDEDATLLGFLERQRATFAWKSGDLDAAGHSPAPSLRYILLNMI